MFLMTTRRRKEREITPYRRTRLTFSFLLSPIQNYIPCVVRTFFVNIVTNGQRGRVENDDLGSGGWSEGVVARRPAIDFNNNKRTIYDDEGRA